MFDTPQQANLQRARGRAAVTWRWQDGRTRLADLHQSGCAKMLLPKTHGTIPEAVIVNTSGGITGGDRLDYAAAVEAGASGVVTTQAAERVYRAASGTGRIDTRLTVAPRASLAWLPQETILFDGGRLARRLDVDMAADASLLLLETVVLGRAAMGETVETAEITDQWRVRRDGRLVLAEALRLTPPFSATTTGPASLGAARAFATLALVAPDAEDRLDEARRLLADTSTAAASAWNGLLVCRFLSPDARALRSILIRFLTEFRRHPLPRVWQS